jgi:hypothetical protein
MGVLVSGHDDVHKNVLKKVDSIIILILSSSRHFHKWKCDIK